MKIVGKGFQRVLPVLAGLVLTIGTVRAADPGDAITTPATPPIDTSSGVAGATLTNAAAADNPPQAPATPAPEVSLSPGASELVKLAQAGLGEDVMLAYVANSNSRFNLGSDQIVFLNDLGVTGDVVNAMIQRDASLQAASDSAVVNPPATPANPIPPTAYDTSAPPPMVDNSVAPDTGDSPTMDDADYFYNSLAPYGNWVFVTGYGVCWQPTVYLGNRDWRPYNDRGRWVYSDCGWYWQSDYSWGWAAFHYGRWFNEPRVGWVWMPDHVWAPAWVSWRQSADYCGWAPLPPAAHFKPGIGFTIGRQTVAAGFEFGLRPAQYTFIPIERLSDYTPARYAVPAWQAPAIQSQTVLANHFTVQNHRVVNQNIDPAQVAALARTEIRRAEIREVPRSANKPVQPDRMTKSGGSMVILRPQLPAPTVRHFTGSRPALGPAGNPGLPRTSSTASPSPANPEQHPLPNMVILHAVNPTPNTPPPVPQSTGFRPLNYTPGSAVSYQNATAPAARPDAGRPTAGFSFNGNYNRPPFNEHLTLEAAPAPAQTTYVIPSHYSVAERLNAQPQNNYPQNGYPPNYPGGAPDAVNPEPQSSQAAAVYGQPAGRGLDAARFHSEGERIQQHSEPPPQQVQHEIRQDVPAAERAAAAEHFAPPAPASLAAILIVIILILRVVREEIRRL